MLKSIGCGNTGDAFVELGAAEIGGNVVFNSGIDAVIFGTGAVAPSAQLLAKKFKINKNIINRFFNYLTSCCRAGMPDLLCFDDFLNLPLQKDT